MTDKSIPQPSSGLTLKEERAIRAYLLKLVLPTGTAMVALSFVLGFLIQHGAQNEAATNAFKAATNVMLEAVQSVATAKATASNVAHELQNIQQEAERISNQLRTTDAFSKSSNLVTRVAETIAKRSDFSAKVSALPSEIETLRLRLLSLETALKSPSQAELPASGGNARTSSCPPGAYMIGARIQSDRGGPHGIISSIIPVCKQILP